MIATGSDHRHVVVWRSVHQAVARMQADKDDHRDVIVTNRETEQGVSHPTISRQGELHIGRFRAMASPCEIWIDGASPPLARRLVELGWREARRIERRFSRYRDGNVVHRINNSRGRPVDVDAETARLLDFATQCHELSDGRFDITSGVLRRAWTFDGSTSVPAPELIEELLPLVGWHRVTWSSPRLILPGGMQVDFGGIGKEYAVDRVVELLRERSEHPVLVNFGGDLHASAAPISREAWQVGVEAVYDTVDNAPSESASTVLALHRGALATSGDARRFVISNGKRYGHVLDPRTGWPVEHAARSITVAANTCTQAGMLSTMSLLAGAEAESLLDAEGVDYWCQRD